MLKTYTGSCHCGAVRFEADIDPADLPLQLLGLPAQPLLAGHRHPGPVPPAGRRGGVDRIEALTEYRFNSLRNSHHFCRTCGVRPFGIGNNVPEGDRIYGVNLGCLENATPEELAAAPIVYIDGAHDRWQDAPALTGYL